MEYLLLIYEDATTPVECQTPSNEDGHSTVLDEYMAFTKEVESAGILLGANPLQPIETATTVRIRNGKTETVDGPFAETKENLAGYYLLNCQSQDEALTWAAKIPGAKWGSIEVRPIMNLT
ncbi:YciI family protein [Pelagicoccus mobilis]|uniref:YciI family protein n=1 Tax=Pelagicoccus mobilis TaxID=415221 RepID=A0A934VP18_9BACT|nr:YciI family protein [Pelagicoccus mobilis]MBK1880536.1 YciI family protein [Pelagicoccus mobilis]